MSRKDNDRAAQGGSIAAHILAFVGVTLLAAVVLLTAAGLMLKFGPSPAAGEKFGEMGAPEFFTGLFLSEDEAGAPAQTQAPEVNE